MITKEKKPVRHEPAAVIARRKSAIHLRRGYVELLCRILLILAVGYLLQAYGFLLTQAQGNGMFPAVKDGDLLIGFRLQEQYAKDDVVVYTSHGTRTVGRIAAKEGDVVLLDDSGTLVVNGTVQTSKLPYPSYAKAGIEYPYIVPEGHVFILGDYRTQTVDSRDFGPIVIGDVEARVITILRRQGI